MQMVPDLRLRTNFKTYWDTVREQEPHFGVISAIREAGLYGVYATGMLRHDAGLCTAFVERWRPETHTFHLRFGEVTITLEDVYFCLGLRSTGRPVVLPSPFPTEADVHELLGVQPDRGVVQRRGINIPWLVRHFGTCDDLRQLQLDDPRYQTVLLYHIRAHILLVLGSLFPQSSGSRLPLSLLHYVRIIQDIPSYSWGSACLAYLYHHMCLASIGHKTELCGSSTLLQVPVLYCFKFFKHGTILFLSTLTIIHIHGPQVWIYERFRNFAPVHRDSYLMLHPRALRYFLH